MGDFNHPYIDWQLLQAATPGSEFLELTQDCFLTQHVQQPTHIQGNILDLILTSEPDMVEEIEVREQFVTSHHHILTFDIIVSITLKDNPQTAYDYKRGDYDGMRAYMSNIQWNTLLAGKTTEEMWEIFKVTMDSAVKDFIPTRKTSSKSKPKWMTKAAMRAARSKYHLWKRYTASKSYQDYLDYKRALNKATREVRNAKRNFEQKLAQNIKKDSKSFYAYTRSKLKTKDKVGPLKDENGETITENTETASVLNTFFTSVFTKEILDNLPEPRKVFTESLEEELHNINITPEIVLKKLSMLKPDKAPGVDSIFPRVLKELSAQISEPLTEIFKSSVTSSMVPLDWKSANVAPIFKKGQRSQSANYRPVSLTSHICKLLESIIRDFIVEHLKNHKLIKDSQHGFVSGKSCLTNLLLFLDTVTKYVDKGFPVDIIYLDFAKAFDKVPHKRLISKVKAHGITGLVSNWIEAWLTDRRQRVQVCGASSEWSEVISGVPQGSVLGPVLFVIYINDIDDNTTSGVIKFADDTKVYGMSATEEEVKGLQMDLDKMFDWSVDWQMLFNVGKCKVIHAGYNNRGHVYKMNGRELESIDEEKDL
jgi:hypothetical protein